MILADTTFLIDCLRKKAEISAFLDKYPDEILFTTEINVFELYLGLFSSKLLQKNTKLLGHRKARLEELLTNFQILPFTRREAITSAKILGTLFRTGQPIDSRDCFIAGIALANGIQTILTKNVGHFDRIIDIKAIWY